MTPPKRALLYICRKKKFSILLFLLLALLFSACLMGIIMVRGLEDTQSTLRRTFAGSFYVSTNWGIVGTQPETVSGFEFLDDEMAAQIGDFEGIAAVNATSYDYFCSDELQTIPNLFASILADTNPADKENYDKALAFSKMSSYSFNSYSELATEFRTGQFILTEGRHITPDDVHVVLISDEVAEKNDLAVGDSFYAYQTSATSGGNFSNYDGIGFDLEIIGIYHVEASQKITKYTNETDIAANKIFADIRTKVETQQLANDYVYYPFVYFFVDDPAHIDEIMAAEQERDDIPWEYYLIGVDESEYSTVAEPLRSMHTTILVITCIVVAVLLILLYLVLRMSLQSRKQETKIYRCLGYSKRNIWGQFVIEGVLLALLAFIPAAALAPPCTAAMGGAVENIVAAQNEEPPEYSEAEIAAAMRDGSFVNMMEDMQKLYLDEPVEIDMDTGLTLPVVLASMAAGLAAVVLFVSIQSRELLNAGLR